MKKLFYISILILAVAACKIGKNYEGHDVVLPQSYAQTDSLSALATPPADTVNTDSLNRETVNDLQWWAMFSDPTLDTLIREAIHNNRNVLIAAENIIQARYALNIQNAQMLPNIDFSASARRGTFVLNNIESDPTNLLLGYGSVAWEIDIWGKYRRLSEAKKSEMMASEHGYRSLMLTLISDVASNYFTLLQARAELEIAKKNVNLRDSMLYIIGARYDRGYTPKIDLNQAQIQKAIAEGTVPYYERKVAFQEHLISVLIGRNPGRIATDKLLQDENLEIEIPAKTPLQLLERRPDILASEFYIKAQNAYVGAAQGNRLPSLNMFAIFGVGANNGASLSLQNPLWTIGGQLVGPLFHWGELKRQVDIEKSKRLQSYYQFENTVFNALREVEDALIEVNTVKREIKIGTERQTAAMEAQMLSQERYSQGVTSYLEYLESQRQAFDAELNLANKQGNLLIAYMRLYKALGGGWITENEKKTAEESEKK